MSSYARTEMETNGYDVRVFDLRSDTVTKPTAAMRMAMAKAEVGDDVYGEDPTINELEAKFNEITGKEASVFFPSGTMGNLAAVMAHCHERGSEVLLGDMCHIYNREQGGISTLGSIACCTLRNRPDGTFDIEEMKDKIKDREDIHSAYTALICLENTHNV